MPDPNGDEFRLDLEEPGAFLKNTPAIIERQKARTANLLAILLVGGVLLSLPLHLVTMWLAPQAPDAVTAVFDKWYALVSPLAGAAVGAYYATRTNS